MTMLGHGVKGGGEGLGMRWHDDVARWWAPTETEQTDKVIPSRATRGLGTGAEKTPRGGLEGGRVLGCPRDSAARARSTQEARSSTIRRSFTHRASWTLAP